MKKLIYLLPLLLIPGCITASTFGLKEDVYKRRLASIKHKTFPFSMKYIHWQGNSEKAGIQKADFIKKNPDIFQVFKDSISFSGVKSGDHTKVRKSLKKYFPEILEEIRSFASNFNMMSEEEMTAIAGSHFHIGGCSIYMNTSPFPYMARNYDWAPTLVDGIISSYERTGNTYASIVVSSSIFGGLSGINEHGLAIALAGINSKKKFPDNGGLSLPIIIRGVLDRAKDVNSAITLLNELPHTTACNYALLDKSGNMAVVEVSSGSINIRRNKSRNFLAATNHFQSISNEDEGVRVMPNSLRRQKSLEEFNRANPHADTDAVFNFMTDPEKGPAMRNYSMIMGTIWTIMYIPEETKMIIRIGINGDRKAFTVGDKNEEILRGELTDLPFKFSDYIDFFNF